MPAGPATTKARFGPTLPPGAIGVSRAASPSPHVILEGQEETGGETLYKVLAENGHLWKADAGIVSDTAFFSEDIPTLTTGLRGLLYTEVRVDGPTRDLHSGTLGGIVQNPAWALATILSRLKGPDGRITIPGFYDEVLPPDATIRRQWQTLPAHEAHYLAITGAPALWGEVGFSPLERATIRPTLDIHGLYSGYIGEEARNHPRHYRHLQGLHAPRP